MNRPFEPKLITVLREGYSWALLRGDVLAGIVVGIVAVPLSIAFAIASGVRPEQGLITAVIAGFLISLLSGSRVQIGGPTGAFIVIIYGIVQQYGYEGLAVATIMAGVFLVLLGLARFGDVIKFIPYPVTVGFTGGIAVIIFTTEINDFLGLGLNNLPNHSADKWMTYASHLGAINGHAVLIGLITVFILVFWRKVTDRIPGPLMAILVTTWLVWVLQWPVETIGTHFGAIPNIIPSPKMPNIDMAMIIKMSQPALAIALLAGIESLLSAVVADGMTGRRHRSNMELIAQGAANIVVPFFQGIPATGAIARTATNIKNGGTTPVAGIIHALTVLAVFVFFGKWAAYIPMPCLAGILVVVAYTMSEWHLFVRLFRGPKSDVMVLMCTFLLTVFVDLIVAIQVGVVLAAFLFMKRMVDVTQVNYLTDGAASSDPGTVAATDIPKGVDVFEINGPFFFGAADKFESTMRAMKRRPRVIILRMRFVPSIDATGLKALENLLASARRDGAYIFFAEVQERTLSIMQESGFAQMAGETSFYSQIEEALTAARGKI